MRFKARIPRFLMAGTTAGLIASASVGVRAQTRPFYFLGSGAAVGHSVTIHYTTDGSTWASHATLAGRYKGSFVGQNDSNAFNVFCVDAIHDINWGTSFQTQLVLAKTTDPGQPLDATAGFYQSAGLFGGSTPGGLISPLEATYAGAGTGGRTDADYSPRPSGTSFTTFSTMAERVSAVAYLGDTYLKSTVTLTADQAAGIQLAIWKILVDGATGSLIAQDNTANNKNGFYVTGASSNVLSLVAGYISAASSNTGFGPTNHTDYIQAQRQGTPAVAGNHVQEFMYYDTQSIPEPAFFQLASLIGLGGLGLLRMRRRNTKG